MPKNGRLIKLRFSYLFNLWIIERFLAASRLTRFSLGEKVYPMTTKINLRGVTSGVCHRGKSKTLFGIIILGASVAGALSSGTLR